MNMRKWMEEDWEFTVEVVKGCAVECRLGLEQGDTFTFGYGCPGGFCPKTMPVVHTHCEILRSGGDFRLRGSSEQRTITFPCADGPITFRLTGRRIG